MSYTSVYIHVEIIQNQACPAYWPTEHFKITKETFICKFDL